MKTAEEVVSRVAVLEDLDDIVRIEKVAWPSERSMQASPAKFERRIANGQVMITFVNGRPAGYITCFRPNWIDVGAVRDLLDGRAADLVSCPPIPRWRHVCDQFGFAQDWHEATGDGEIHDDLTSTDPHAKVVFGVGVATDPELRGLGVADRVLRAAQLRARRDGAQYFIAYGRLPGFAAGAAQDVETHMRERRNDGAPTDRGLRIHWRRGAIPISAASGLYLPIPQSMWDDKESDGWGFLVTVPLVSGSDEHPRMDRNASRQSHAQSDSLVASVGRCA